MEVDFIFGPSTTPPPPPPALAYVDVESVKAVAYGSASA